VLLETLRFEAAQNRAIYTELHRSSFAVGLVTNSRSASAWRAGTVPDLSLFYLAYVVG